MKEKKAITNVYKTPGAALVTAALAVASWGPYLLMAVTMALTKHSVPHVLSIAESAAAAVIAILCLLAGISLLRDGSKNFIKLVPKSAGWALWLAAVYLFYGFVSKVFLSKIGLLKVSQRTMILGISILICVVTALIAGFIFVKLVCAASGAAAMTKSFVPNLILSAVGLALLELFPFFTGLLMAYLPGYSSLSSSGAMILAALVSALFIVPVVSRTASSAPEGSSGSGEASEAKTDEADTKRKASPAVSLISGAVVCAAVIAVSIFSQPRTAIKYLENSISNSVSQGIAIGSSGDFMQAAQIKYETQAVINAWRGAVLNESNALRNAYEQYPGDEEIQILYAVTNNNYSNLEAMIMADEEVSDELMLVLLDSYSGTDEKNRAKQNDLCSMCIASGNFVNSFIYPESLKNKETQFASMLGKQEERLASLDVYELLAKAPVMGSNSKEYMQYALDMAEKHPDNLLIQSAALEAGSGYGSDSKSHYARTAKAAQNLLSIIRSQDHSAEELESAELQIASKLMLIGETSDAMELIKAHKDSNLTAAELYIANLYNSKKYTECQTEAKAVLDKWNSDRAAYMMGLSAVNNGDVDSYIDAALNLSSQIRKAEDRAELARLDNEIYIMLEHVVLQDGPFNTPYYTNYKLGRANYFTEERVSRIMEDDFIGNYLESLYNWSARNYDDAFNEIDYVLSVKDDLPLAHYHKGILFYQREAEGDTLRAKDEFTRSTELDDQQMTSWYMLACACDKLGDYQEALNACNRVLALNPDSDHSVDHFGVGAHAQVLKSRLENYIREGK